MHCGINWNVTLRFYCFKGKRKTLSTFLRAVPHSRPDPPKNVKKPQTVWLLLIWFMIKIVICELSNFFADNTYSFQSWATVLISNYNQNFRQVISYFIFVCLLKLILYNSKPQNQLSEWTKDFCFLCAKTLTQAFLHDSHIWL